VDYDEVVAAVFQPRPDGTPVPEVVASAGPARRLRDAAEPVAMHAVWSRRTNERLAPLGLDFFAAYVGGRAASLGDPVGAVVAAAFAWFEPSLIIGVHGAGRAAAAPAQILAVRDEATTASLREVLGDDDPTEVADVLADAVERADGTGRPLFSGLRSRGRPADPVQRLWWACDLVREHRGDSHVAAAAAAGIGPVEMNILTERWLGMPLHSYTASRGWAPAAVQAATDRLAHRGWVAGASLTDAGRAARSAVEAGTDAQEQEIVDALGDRLDDVCRQLETWSARCIEQGAFPPDALKRAAG
jgi:hypothetical protein